MTLKHEIEASANKNPFSFNLFAYFILAKMSLPKELLYGTFKLLLEFELVS